MDLRSLHLIGEGGDHDVFQHPHDSGRVLKVPKKKLAGRRRIEEMTANLRDARLHFGPWLAETAIEKNSRHGYVVQQEKIEGDHVRPDALSVCGNSFFALHDVHRKMLVQEGLGIDFFGLEGAWKTVLSHIRHHRGTVFDVLIIRPLLHAAATAGNVFPLFHSFHTAPAAWKSQDPLYPELSNILQKRSSPTQVKIVDVDMLRGGKEGYGKPFRTRAVTAFQDFFLERYFGTKHDAPLLPGRTVA